MTLNVGIFSASAFFSLSAFPLPDPHPLTVTAAAVSMASIEAFVVPFSLIDKPPKKENNISEHLVMASDISIFSSGR
ncbi:hypothetical protein [Paenibacillus konkukensis]|uniref:hypothetical protein n=1 Tax=Paenibacillus konkukensis TaxID=2020716 RepID=UPI00201D32EA|nr:hypothetical protein [Paenibacillus konkukensis]